MEWLQVLLAAAVGGLIVMLALYFLLRSRIGIDSNVIKDAIQEKWSELNINQALQDIGAIKQSADNMLATHKDLERILTIPHERGYFGEFQLKVILSDQLPAETFGIQQIIPNGKRPDAHIKLPNGILCIDSKFPLEDFKQYLACDTEDEKERNKKRFRDCVKGHLDKIARDYIAPSQGTTPFAVAYLPSEAVMYHLVKEEHQVLREYARQGVYVVSPLSFSYMVELIGVILQSERLSKNAENVKKHLEALRRDFENVDSEWQTLRRHIRNAFEKSQEVDNKYSDLKRDFKDVSKVDSLDLE